MTQIGHMHILLKAGRQMLEEYLYNSTYICANF